MNDLEFLRSREIFRGLSTDELKNLLSVIEEERFAPGDTIVKRGEPGTAMYLIKQGSAEVALPAGDDRPRFVALLGPGDIFGETALLTGEPRGGDVIATGDVEVVCKVFDKAVVDTVIKNAPAVARFLTEVVGKRLRESGSLDHVGKYRILGELGRGGAAIVFDGFHPGLNRPVAIKMLNHALVREGDFLERIQREAQLIADLAHENIVQVFDTESAYATFFIVMERLCGTELSTLIKQGPSDVDEVVHVVRQTARALHYAHQRGVVHNDVKPSNIFIDDTGRAKLMDFGIAAPPQNTAGEPPKGIMGTPGYLAPELMLGGVIDGRADLYGLGVVAYEMLLGKSAFPTANKVEVLRRQLVLDGLTLPEPLRSAHPALTALIHRATRQRPEDRFAHCEELLEALDERGGPSAPLAPGRPPAPGGRASATLTVSFDPAHRNTVKALLDEAARKFAHLDDADATVADDA